MKQNAQTVPRFSRELFADLLMATRVLGKRKFAPRWSSLAVDFHKPTVIAATLQGQLAVAARTYSQSEVSQFSISVHH